MTHRRQTRQHRTLTPAGHYLVVLLTMLALVVTPLSDVLATPAQQGDEYQVAQDGNENPQDENPNEVPPPEPIATEPKPTDEPPVEVRPTEAPVESKPTEEPPVEVKPTEGPDNSKPTEEPPVEVKPTDEPATDSTPDEPLPTEPSASATPSALPPNAGGPGLTTSSTLVMVTGLCDYRAYNFFAAANLAQLLANCIPYSSDSTFTYTSDTGTRITQATSGSTTRFSVPDGEFSMQAQIPSDHHGYVVGCESTGLTGYPIFLPGNGSVIRTMVDPGATLTCYWFSSPIPPTTITVVKGLCDDPGFDPYSATSAELAANCTQASGDATFTYQEMYTGAPNELMLVQTSSGSTTTFDVSAGNFSLREDIPAGFGEPVVSCHIARINWTILPDVNVDTIQGHIDLGDTYTCQWYNVTLGSTSHLTVRTWDCPPGYDHVAPAANPRRDCTQPLDGVEFQIEGIDNGAFASAVTGEDMPGVVTFLDLVLGNYTVTESLPTGYAASFVWTCTGTGIPASPTMPIVTGVTLTITTVAGWNTTCHWFNVQEPVSSGSLTVTKYTCGPSILRDWSLCPIYKQGQEFDLLQWTGDAWVSVGTGTTDKYGRYTWIDLTPGSYVLEESGRDWCHISSANMSAGDKAITVEPGEEAIVHVYNCAETPISPPIRVVNVLALLLRDFWDPMP